LIDCFFAHADLSNIFESFLPQLLTYPNPIDPLNGDAAAMYLHKPEEYKKKVSEYVRKYATEDALRDAEANKDQSGGDKAGGGSSTTNGTGGGGGGTANGNGHSTNNLSSDSESSMSDFSEDEARDMEL